MHKNYIKVFLNALLILACVFFHSCKDQDTVTPQKDQTETNNDVLQKIKSLGFADNQIKEMPNYYLADGDVYFSKKIPNNTAPAKKSGHRILEKYATLTVHLDESLTNVIDDQWSRGIHQAIAEWNAKKDVHFHFAFTESESANINIIKDIDLPKDLAIASEFPRNGRTGSSIRINVAATKVVQDPKQAFAHALEHCVGFLHSTSAKNKNVNINSNALKSAKGPRFNLELYAIQGDILYRVDATTGEYFAVDGGWAGTEVMGQIGGWLYMVQFGTLWQVNPSTGAWTGLTDGWAGSQFITSIPGATFKLYIMQDSWIWPVDPDTGLWDADLGSYTLGRGLLGFYDQYQNKYKLAVLRRKKGSSTVSLIYTLDPSSGALLDNSTIPASGVDGWNGNFFLTTTTQDLIILNGMINWVTFRCVRTGGLGKWPGIGVATSYGNTVYFVDDRGILLALNPIKLTINQLGDGWLDTSLMVMLQ